MRPLAGAALLEHLLSVPSDDRDAQVDAMFGFEAPPEDIALPRGAVPYLPCGVDEIIAMVREVPVRPEDLLVDLGSGVGRVAIITHLLTGARTRGVEIQAHLVEVARARCAALGLDRVTFEHANAETAGLEGTIFFLYAPFNGEMLARVLKRLEAVARQRPITVCTVDLELRDVPWLDARETSSLSLMVYRSRRTAT